MKPARRSKPGFHRKVPLLIALGVGMLVGVVLVYAFWFLFVKERRPLPVSPKIAIVLDDWGYSAKRLPLLESIRQPVTVAILPGLPYSSQIAQRAHAHGTEVILHQPMEAQDPNVPREGSVLSTGMSKRQVREQLEWSLAKVPFALGINNHQGSKATADPQLMGLVFKEVKRRGLYFLDSYVTAQSVCFDLARQLRLRFVRRAVFLDNDPTPAAIRRQVWELAKIASTHGEALGIGHDRPHTLEVLKETIPQLQKAGYTLVHASRLARVPENKS